MKNARFWYLLAALICILEIINIHLMLDGMLPNNISLIVSVLLCLVFFLYIGNKSNRGHDERMQQVEDIVEGLKLELGGQTQVQMQSLKNPLGALKKSIDASNLKIESAIIEMKNATQSMAEQMQQELDNSSVMMRNVLADMLENNKKESDKLNDELTGLFNAFSENTSSGIWQNNDSIRNGITELKSVLNVMNQTNQSFADTQAESMKLLADNQDSIMEKLKIIYKEIYRNLEDSHRNILRRFNDVQLEIICEMANEVGYMKEAVKDNHISNLNIVRASMEDILDKIDSCHNASLSVARDNHISALSVIHGGHEDMIAVAKESYNTGKISEVGKQVDKFIGAEKQAYQLLAQSIDTQTFRTEMLMEDLNKLRDKAADNRETLLAKYDELDSSLRDIRAIITMLQQAERHKNNSNNSVNTEAARKAGDSGNEAGSNGNLLNTSVYNTDNGNTNSNDVDLSGEQCRTESYKDPVSGYIMHKFYSNNILVSSDMCDGDQVKYDVSYNPDGQMVSSRNYDSKGVISSEFIYDNGKITTRIDYVEQDGQRVKKVRTIK